MEGNEKAEKQPFSGQQVMDVRNRWSRRPLRAETLASIDKYQTTMPDTLPSNGN
jgi:hypothetical protein